jgi:hypothetical protein
MSTVDHSDSDPLGGVTVVRRFSSRCEMCRRFARLLPGETRCAGCSGVLALEFPTITNTADAVVRGGW